MASFQPSPVGYGFHPTDEELVDHYLRLKMLGGFDQQVGIIAEVKVCDYEPWELPGRSMSHPNDRECYFFCPPNYKYPNSPRAKRTTGAGYWKVTGKDRTIKKKSTGTHIATKKTLVYYEGRPNSGVKTNWIMHEYNPTFNFNNQRDFVLCKLKKDPDDMTEFEEGESSSNVEAYGFENQYSNESNYTPTFEDGGYGPRMTSNFPNNMLDQEDYSHVQAQLDSFHGYDDRDYSLNSALQFPYGNGNMY